MPIEFSCPHCQAHIRVAEGAGGKQGTCPQCRQKLVVPTNPAPPPAITSPPVQFRSADPEPVAPVSTSNETVPEAFPQFEEPRNTTSYARKLRQKKRRSASSLAVPLICGGILFGTFYWYVFHSKPGLTGTLQTVVLAKPVPLQGSITRAGLSVDSDAFERVRESLEEKSFSLVDQQRLAEVELSANDTAIVVNVNPKAAARMVSVSLNDPELRKYVADHAREFNDVRVRQIAFYADDFVRSWDEKSDTERQNLPHLGKYRADMALASLVSGFGYHVALWSGTSSYPCVGMSAAGELYFCVPKSLDQYVLKGHRPTPDSLLFPGEYTIQVPSTTPTPTAKEKQMEPEQEPESTGKDSEIEPMEFEKPKSSEPESPDKKMMKPTEGT